MRCIFHQSGHLEEVLPSWDMLGHVVKNKGWGVLVSSPAVIGRAPNKARENGTGNRDRDLPIGGSSARFCVPFSLARFGPPAERLVTRLGVFKIGRQRGATPTLPNTAKYGTEPIVVEFSLLRFSGSRILTAPCGHSHSESVSPLELLAQPGLQLYCPPLWLSHS
ncbi:hypothetical protein GY45DRAFT_631389 [Cubamyces sp. BRFM 1775]|nr:hypothetical protein GY45DRAFT_631389 [Cubamyces sp. BRFM 1775]